MVLQELRKASNTAWNKSTVPQRNPFVREMCGVQLNGRKTASNFMLKLDFKETIYQSAMTNSVQLNGHVLGRENGHIFRREIENEDDGQRKNGG